jgi:hypothetical protein
MKFIIQRPIDGISLNGNETAVDDDGNVLFFDTEQEAVEFLHKDEDEETIALINEDLESGALQINGYMDE